VRGDKVASPAAPQAIGALTAVLGVAKSLKELGLTADPQDSGAISLVELVARADAALARVRVSLRPERTVEGSACAVRLMDVASAARLAPGSTDALVLLGQTSTESAVPTTDDVRTALLGLLRRGAASRTPWTGSARASRRSCASRGRRSCSSDCSLAWTAGSRIPP
jgi:hypothetical protein